ncbi:hypothetical protein GCM10027098_28110 [Bowmanella dokdonensis]
MLSGCGFLGGAQKLQVELRYQGRHVPCGTSLNMQGGGWYIEHSKFYLSQIQNEDGEPLDLADNQWQTGETALISIEQKDCWRDGEMAGNHEVRFGPEVDLSEVKRLRFVLGLPFELNHQNPLTQPSPLNLSSMFWTWQSGHKFARFELRSVADSWAFHLGSTGCEADSKLRSPAQPCSNPNLIEFDLPRPAGSGNTLVFHLDRLLEGITLNRDNSCTFHAGEMQSCEKLLANLHKSVIEWI